MRGRARRSGGWRALLRGAAAGVLYFVYGVRRSPELLVWYVVFPLLLLLGARYLVFTPGGGLTAGVYPDGGGVAAALEAAGFNVAVYDSLEALLRDLSNGRIAVGVDASVSPPRILYSLDEYSGAALLALAAVNGLDPGSLLGLASLAGGIVERVPPGPLADAGRALAFYAVSLVGVTALYSGLYGGFTSLVEMRINGMIRVVAGSPGGPLTLLGYLLGFNIAAVALTAIVLLVAALLLGADYSGFNPAGAIVAAVLLLAGLVAVFAASMPLGLLVRRAELAAALAGIGGFALIFATGLAIPRDFLPEPLRSLAGYSPLTVAVEKGGEALLGYTGALEALLGAWPLWASLPLAGALGVVAYKRLVSYAVEAE